MKRKNAIAAISVLSIFSVITLVFTISTINKNTRANRELEESYRRALSEIVTGVEELDSALQKSVLVTSPGVAGTVCAEIYATAQSTLTALEMLPFSETELEKTVGFVNSVGDFAFSLTQKAARGEEFTQEERDALRSLSESAAQLRGELKGIEEGSQKLSEGISISEKEFPEMPRLIYDGALSYHMKNAKPKLLEGRAQIDESQGRENAAAFIGVRPGQVYYTGEREGKIPALCYEIKQNGERLGISVTKTGGVVTEVQSSRKVTKSTLTPEEALAAAKRLIQRWGYENMAENGYRIENKVLTASFTYVQNDVLVYPDLIRVGIALDTGTLQSFESQGYVSGHHERQIPEAAISREQGRERVPEGLSVYDEKTAIIPSPGGREILCHEFKCEDLYGKKFIIYVNAITGNQEKILRILEDENGTLTM